MRIPTLKTVLLGLSLIAGPSMAGPLPRADAPFPEASPEAIKLGQLLFYDPILSGNKTVACASCHLTRFGTSDGLSLGIGDGGIKFGNQRRVLANNMPENRIPRNAPALFNLGTAEFTRLFHDGRLEVDLTRASGFRTPMGLEMETGFSGVLAAQAMFPVLSPDEMAGHYGESDISQKVSQGLITGPDGAWDIIAKRVEAVPEYRQRFDAVIGADTPVHFTDIANAIADFTAYEWRADNSPFDQYLRYNTPLADPALRGLNLFYGPAGCADCHSGQFQTDHDFHAIAMPQIGPGKAASFENHHHDTGRMRVTGQPTDAYAFLTPSLRNITLSAPYGHAGAFATLEGVVRHHLDPINSLRNYDLTQATLPDLPGAMDDWVITNPAEIDAIAAVNTLAPMPLSDAEINDILAFLHSLEDPISSVGRLGVPSAVPSGLAVPR